MKVSSGRPRLMQSPIVWACLVLFLVASASEDADTETPLLKENDALTSEVEMGFGFSWLDQGNKKCTSSSSYTRHATTDVATCKAHCDAIANCNAIGVGTDCV